MLCPQLVKMIDFCCLLHGQQAIADASLLKSSEFGPSNANDITYDDIRLDDYSFPDGFVGEGDDPPERFHYPIGLGQYQSGLRVVQNGPRTFPLAVLNALVSLSRLVWYGVLLAYLSFALCNETSVCAPASTLSSSPLAAPASKSHWDDFLLSPSEGVRVDMKPVADKLD